MGTAKEQFCSRCGKNITNGLTYYYFDYDEITKPLCSDCWYDICKEKDRGSSLDICSDFLIQQERKRQIQLWGDQSHLSLPVYYLILSEEKGELAEAILETVLEGKHPERGGREKILKEAIQVAAVAKALVESILNWGFEDRDKDQS